MNEIDLKDEKRNFSELRGGFWGFGSCKVGQNLNLLKLNFLIFLMVFVWFAGRK
jgi:hypothetical protein